MKPVIQIQNAGKRAETAVRPAAGPLKSTDSTCFRAVNSSLTENTSNTDNRGIIAYDGECRICIALSLRFEPLLRRHFQLLPLQTPALAGILAKTGQPLLHEMRVITPNGEIFGGAEGLIAIARQFWWSRPIAWVGSVAVGRRFLHKLYRWFAERRHCSHGRCELHRGVGTKLEHKHGHRLGTFFDLEGC